MDAVLARLAMAGPTYPEQAKLLVQETGNDPEKFKIFIRAMLHPNTEAHVARHAASITEKVARRYPYLVLPYQPDLLAALPNRQTSPMRWHVGLLLSYLRLADDSLALVLDYLYDWLQNDPNKFMKVHCLQALANFSTRHDWLRAETIQLVKVEMAKGGAAANAKGRKLLQQLQA
ncbi:hypothetical protein [Adhaeribacter pallidiroseus]|uniref:Uncharacterized protein n=1 Tax=Adhaeribacter pallidiroseus TaxID=2072847 RepID=A0A369QNJ9_9BACT|nr:hypothetical protein [Adhaeribacter pallidiroseus]RDC64836.1 hypothetical protein AHMF7616_03456 [Adhaeribacter pallidiroseus]